LGAQWPHGCRRQCSEVAVPALVGSNLTEGGRFFPRKEPPPGHGCVCMSFRADGRVVEGRATLFRHHREVSRVRIPGRMGLPWMFVFVFVLWRPEKGERRREGGVGGRGKYPGAPPHHIRKREEKQADRKVPDRPVGERGSSK
jgi:hypothetical protein